MGDRVGEAESRGEEPGRGPDTAEEARERARRLRAQAALAWMRVQEVTRRGPAPRIHVESFLQALEEVPDATYLAGIGGSILVSAWLHAAGRRTAGGFVGLSAPLILGLALWAKALRRSRRI